MTDENKKIYEWAIARTERNFNQTELAIGCARYVALRRLNPSQFAEHHRRNIQGENFDKMIDDLIVFSEKEKQ